MRIVLALAAAVLMVSSASAQAKGKAAPKKSADDPLRVVQLDEEIANIVDADKNDCDKMAADVNTWVAKNKDEMHRLREEGKTRTAEQRADFQKRYRARVQAATAKMNAGIGKCIQNPKVKAALSGLN